jgi:hypothetical protein
MNKLEESHEAYQVQRAIDKYDGKVEKSFPVKEFRKSADYLASVLEKVDFDAEDVGDLVRVALSRRVKTAGVKEQGSDAKS